MGTRYKPNAGKLNSNVSVAERMSGRISYNGVFC